MGVFVNSVRVFVFLATREVGVPEVDNEAPLVGINVVDHIILVYQVDVVAHDAELGQSGIVLSFLGSLCEGVAHNGNQHVEESDYEQKCSHKVENVDDELLLTILKGIRLKLTQTELIQNDKGI